VAAGTNASSGLVARTRPGGPLGAVWLPAALLVALLLTHVLWLWLRLGGIGVTTDVDGVFILGSAAVAAALCGRRARASRERRVRLGWWLLAAFELLFALGIVITIGYTLVLGTVPAPSLADVAYLADAVSAVCAVLLLGGTAWDDRMRMLLDGGIVACSLVLLSWLTVLQTVPRTADAGHLALVLYFAYPILDVITATVVLSTVANYRPVDPSLVLVGVGILALAVSDSAFLTLQYARPGLLDAGYTAASVLIALGALIVRPVRPGDREPHLAPWQVLLPYVPLVPTGAVVTYHLLHHGRLDPIGQVLGTVSVLLVIVRQLMAVLEARTLAATLARTLAEQRILVEQAPVGICRLDGEGRLLSANQRLAKMLGRSPSSLAGVDFGELIHPDDLPPGTDALQEFREGRLDRLAMEARGVRPDGTIVWASATVGPLRDADGRIDRIVAIVEDVTDRKRMLERAAEVQRRLLPQAVPDVPGYEVAGAYRPAQDVAGDFYDWVLGPDGRLDLTVADVMGKGIAAALVMAVVRTALRSAPAALSPVERVRIAASSVALGSPDDVMFVTLFHARLEPATGVVRYVDAGHGHCAIRRASGTLTRLSLRSLPLGAWEDETFEEGETRLEPGDALLAYSDGVVEREERQLDLPDLEAILGDGSSAGDLVERLLAAAGPRLADDVTAVVLRRAPARSGA